MPRKLSARMALARAAYAQIYPSRDWSEGTSGMHDTAESIAETMLADIRDAGFNVTPRPVAKVRKRKPAR